MCVSGNRVPDWFLVSSVAVAWITLSSRICREAPEEPVESWRIPPGGVDAKGGHRGHPVPLGGKKRHLADFLGVNVSKYFECGRYGAEMDINWI